MGLKLSEWIALFCVCAFGIQHSYQFVAEMRDINANCMREGGFCINIIPPRPPRRRTNRRRMRTSTRRGQRARRPRPQDIGASHTRLPASARAAQQNTGYPVAQPTNQAQGFDQFTPIGQMGGGGGTMGAMNRGMGASSTNPFGDMGLGAFMMFTRKKRQAPMDPGEAAEMPRIRAGQNTMSFLNTNCRKTDYDFGCRQTGGICCLPHL